MSIFSATVQQIIKGPPAPRRSYDMSPFEGLTHVTTNRVAQIMEMSQDKARHYVRTLCAVGCLVPDGTENLVTPRTVREVKRFRIVWEKNMHPNIDHADALEALNAAYQMLMEFQEVINDQLEGDHNMAEPVDRWLTWYEKVSK